ncbi:Putative Zinc finger C2H2-type [Septoria linicola]|uniref:Zinc finger C2H2-type n=1 Tax=Septoria linicola TaxID=215465 RepID=A0A9Q9APE9_9PEZI|nr:Putative Zinc finger C2H2-type [Septoria linicola]
MLEEWLKRRQSAIPKIVLCKTATFEDAFGTSVFIDLNIIPSWKVFELVLTEAFSSKPERRGLRRLENKQYRLHDGVRDDLIDPNRRPRFTAVFAPGRHVRMSIYFEWEEVQHEAWPKCEAVQAAAIGAEIRCASCGLIYRVLPTEDEEPYRAPLARTLDKSSASGPMYLQRMGPLEGDFDRPGHFQGISIGERPRHYCTACAVLDLLTSPSGIVSVPLPRKDHSPQLFPELVDSMEESFPPLELNFFSPDPSASLDEIDSINNKSAWRSVEELVLGNIPRGKYDSSVGTENLTPHRSRLQACSHCDQKFEYRKDLVRHLQQHDPKR